MPMRVPLLILATLSLAIAQPPSLNSPASLVGRWRSTQTSKGGIGAVYIRSNYRAEVHSALLAWEDRVRSITEGTARKILPMSPPAS